jgi:hypothetical protein
MSGIYSMELNNRFTASGGIALGVPGKSIEAKTLVCASFRPFAGMQAEIPAEVPLEISLAYVYNGLPAYQSHAHTILPLVSYNGERAGIAVGPGLRFTSFFGEPALFESILSFRAYACFLKKENFLLGIRIANFSDFYVGNMGSYSLCLYSAIRFNEQWSLTNELELVQSGSVALSANFYGIALRGGMRFTW